MDKKAAHSTVTVRDSKTGKVVTVRGAGALKDSRLAIKESVDLTKPLAFQALKSGGKHKRLKG